ncbi:DUF1841 family protein [Luteolibacter sp. SL250]|uniref:DUF1841 family protein n=1 Tax=Luteolibacter sp. SL250 TaxID=2995170 RepID=UPI00226E0CC2|nr:DUF1841 family protein [Luteolibacter sp. SL250]WAC18098.1 DUF1841 family protein [Luteolibacter sp. SL250]
MNNDLLPDLLIAVEQQLVSPQTPYVRKALDRLVKLEIGEADAKTQIAICLGEQMDEVMRTKKPFDEKAYRAALEELPFADEEEDDEEEGEEE